MALFGKKKIKSESKPSAAESHGSSGIKILGSGCAKCNQLEAATKKALAQLGLSEEVEHVTEFSEIAAYGVMSTPALVIDGQVVSYGKVLRTEEIVAILEKLRPQEA